MKNAIEGTPTAPTTPALDVNEVLNALEKWINQRPGLEYANYGAMAPYRAEMRAIAKDKKRALEALASVRRSVNHDPALLADSFKRAFSGRLEWRLPVCDGEVAHLRGYLTYTTGQYWPTEYRKAAASVLEMYDSLLAQKWAAENPAHTFPKFHTIADVRAANKAIGNHWFDRSTMGFFNTRIESGLLTRVSSGRQLFITSERMDDACSKGYTIREAKPDGTIDTVGEFQGYKTLEDARQAVRLIA